jgi:hypothetical protein
MNYAEILGEVKGIHDHLMGLYSVNLDKRMSEDRSFFDVTYAKLSYIAKILKDAKIISIYKEIDVMVEGTMFPRSVMLMVDWSTIPIYLLNFGKDVYVYVGVAIEHPGNLSFLIWSQNNQTKKHSGVLEEDFDWKKFAISVVHTIHESAYKRKDVVDSLIG